MSEMGLDSPRVWADFTDPAEPAARFHVDLTWLTSRYQCIFTSGCPGILADRPDDGCCTLGAYFTDEDDVNRVTAAVARLDPQDWHRHPDGPTPGSAAGRSGHWTETVDGETATRVVDGVCVLFNPPGFAAGHGCALHRWALAHGVAPHTVKPDVCWQLPVRRSYRTVHLPDETSYLEVTIGEYDRRSWGPGGHELDWYCTRSARAHRSAQPLYRRYRDELTELMGPAAYQQLCRHAQAHLTGVSAVRQGEPVRRLLPLLVHPATLEAEAAEG